MAASTYMEWLNLHSGTPTPSGVVARDVTRDLKEGCLKDDSLDGIVDHIINDHNHTKEFLLLLTRSIRDWDRDERLTARYSDTKSIYTKNDAVPRIIKRIKLAVTNWQPSVQRVKLTESDRKQKVQYVIDNIPTAWFGGEACVVRTEHDKPVFMPTFSDGAYAYMREFWEDKFGISVTKHTLYKIKNAITARMYDEARRYYPYFDWTEYSRQLNKGEYPADMINTWLEYKE